MELKFTKSGSNITYVYKLELKTGQFTSEDIT